MKELIKKVLVEMNYVSNVNEVVFEDGIMCIDGLIKWSEIELMNESECKEWIECNVYSDNEIDKYFV
jgi:hypothetical protein